MAARLFSMISSAVCAAAVEAQARTATTTAKRWMNLFIQRLCPASPLKDVTDLELERARRIDVGQRRNRIRRRARRHHLAKRRIHGRGVAVSRLRAAEDVAVIEQVEAFHAQQDRPARRLQASLDKQRDVLRA